MVIFTFEQNKKIPRLKEMRKFFFANLQNFYCSKHQMQNENQYFIEERTNHESHIWNTFLLIFYNHNNYTPTKG